MTLEPLSPSQLARLEQAIRRGLQASATGLAGMIRKAVGFSSPSISLVPLHQVAGCVGGSDEEAVAVYLGASGDMTGHIVLFLPVSSAMRLADLLLEHAPGTTTHLGDIETSALAEVGNLTGSFLLNSLADESGLRLLPSSPLVLRDYAAAVINSIVAELSLAGDAALLMQTAFVGEDDSVQAHFFLLPDIHSLTRLAGALELSQ